MVRKVALIGPGRIGLRHLEGLARTEVPISIAVVGRSGGALDSAKKRLEELAFNSNIRDVKYGTSLDDIGAAMDLVVVATCSDTRAWAVKRLIEGGRAGSLLLEKVLFQREDDLDEIGVLLDKKKIRAWVNCPRRVYGAYARVRGLFDPAERLSMSVEGAEWGLAGNAIHFLDLMAFIKGSSEFTIDPSGLDLNVYESGRKGFVEFSGTLAGTLPDASAIRLASVPGGPRRFRIRLASASVRVEIDEYGGVATVWDLRAGGGPEKMRQEKMPFDAPRQSDITPFVVKDILERGECGLTGYAESAAIHKPLLSAFIRHMERASGRKTWACPVT